MSDQSKNIWPERLRIRDTQLYDDLGGHGGRIYTTAGSGYEKREYVCVELYEHLQAENERLRAALTVAREAISQAPEDAFGSVSEQHDHPGYWIRDELVDRITKALPTNKNVVQRFKQGSKFYCIGHNADCTETGLPMNRTYVRCESTSHAAQESTMLMLEGWCETRFGSRVAYVQGVAPTPGWSIREINETQWRLAKPINWGGTDTETVRLALTLGNKSGMDREHVKVLWEQSSKDKPIPDDATLCPNCGHVLPETS